MTKDASGEKVFNVLFLCTANSARSILAEAILNKTGSPRFKGYSAGSQPRGQVNEHALNLLEKLGHDISFAQSKSWDDFGKDGAENMDFVFTVCDSAAAESCPAWPGHPATAHWGIPDPAAVEGTDAEIGAAFGDAYRMLERRISAFTSLPLQSLDKYVLKQRLGDIGEME